MMFHFIVIYHQNGPFKWQLWEWHLWYVSGVVWIHKHNNNRNVGDLTSPFIRSQGNFVHAGNILATQRLLRYHPGAHVSYTFCINKCWSDAVKMYTFSSCILSCPSLSRRWGWEPTTRSSLWRTATSGSPRRSTSHHHAALRPPRSSPSCQKELCSTRPSSASCQSNRRASLNWWTWSKTDWTGLGGHYFPLQAIIKKDLFWLTLDFQRSKWTADHQPESREESVETCTLMASLHGSTLSHMNLQFIDTKHNRIKCIRKNISREGLTEFVLLGSARSLRNVSRFRWFPYLMLMSQYSPWYWWNPV